MTEIDIVTTTFVLPQNNSWHIVYILLTLKPMLQLPKKPKNSLMKMIWSVSLRTDLALDVMSRIVYRLVEF